MPHYESAVAANVPDLAGQTISFEEAAEHHGSISAVMERYDGDISQCPYLQSLGSAGVALVEQMQAAEKDPNRGPTIAEVLAAKKAERESSVAPAAEPSLHDGKQSKQPGAIFDNKSKRDDQLQQVQEILASAESTTSLEINSPAIEQIPEAIIPMSAAQQTSERAIVEQLKQTEEIILHGSAMKDESKPVQLISTTPKAAGQERAISDIRKYSEPTIDELLPKISTRTNKKQIIDSLPAGPLELTTSPAKLVVIKTETAAASNSDISGISAEEAIFEPVVPGPALEYTVPIPETPPQNVKQLGYTETEPVEDIDDKPVGNIETTENPGENIENPAFTDLTALDKVEPKPPDTETILAFLDLSGAAQIQPKDQKEDEAIGNVRETPSTGEGYIINHIEQLASDKKLAAVEVIKRIQDIAGTINLSENDPEMPGESAIEIAELYSKLVEILSPTEHHAQLMSFISNLLATANLTDSPESDMQSKEKGTMEKKIDFSSKLSQHLAAILKNSQFFSLIGNYVLKNHVSIVNRLVS